MKNKKIVENIKIPTWPEETEYMIAVASAFLPNKEEDSVLTSEQVNELYMECPFCKQLVEKIRIDSDVMCSLCGKLFSPSLLTAGSGDNKKGV